MLQSCAVLLYAWKYDADSYRSTIVMTPSTIHLRIEMCRGSALRRKTEQKVRRRTRGAVLKGIPRRVRWYRRALRQGRARGVDGWDDWRRFKMVKTVKTDGVWLCFTCHCILFGYKECKPD